MVRVIGASQVTSTEHQWAIRSNSGRELFAASFLEEKHVQGATLLLTSAIIHGEFWRAPEFETSNDATPDFQVSLPQLVLDKAKLDEFSDELERWLEKPKEISLSLSGNHPHQALDVSIGPRSGIISTMDKPVFSLRYASGSFELGKWSFVIDQSCIRCLLDELTPSLMTSH